MVIEECAELIAAIQKYRRNRVGLEKVIEEGVDVELMLVELRVWTGNNTLWEKIREEKIARLEELLKEWGIDGK